jgi:hypothetical protein
MYIKMCCKGACNMFKKRNHKPQYIIPSYTAYLENREDSKVRTFGYNKSSVAVKADTDEPVYSRHAKNESRRGISDISSIRNADKAATEPPAERRFQPNRHDSTKRVSVDRESSLSPQRRTTIVSAADERRVILRGDDPQRRSAGADNRSLGTDTRVGRRNMESAAEQRRYNPGKRNSRVISREDIYEKRAGRSSNRYPLYDEGRKRVRPVKASNGRNKLAIIAAGGGLVVALALLFILFKPDGSATFAGALQTPGNTPTGPAVTQTDNGYAGILPAIPTPSPTEAPGVSATPFPTLTPTPSPQPADPAAPAPTATPKPTPRPTSKPTPTPTPKPTATPKPTPAPTPESTQ